MRARVTADALRGDQRIKREISSRVHCISEPLVGEKTRVKSRYEAQLRRKNVGESVTSRGDDCLKSRN